MQKTTAFSAGLLVYLDQNILSDIAGGRLPNIPRSIQNNSQNREEVPIRVDYSHATLDEINISGQHAEIMLDLLDTIEAFYMEPVLKDGRLTDTVNLSPVCPRRLFAEWKKEVGPYQGLTNSLIELNAATYRRGNVNLDSLWLRPIEEIECVIGENLDPALADLDEVTKNRIKSQIDTAFSELRRISGEISKTIGFNAPLLDVLDSMQLSPRFLNNMSPTAAIDKITKTFRFNGIDGRILFGDRLESASGNAHGTKIDKVIAVFTMLEIVGFWRDPKLHEPRNAARAARDLQHVIHAAWCHIFIANDIRLQKKAKAAYQEAEISTIVASYDYDGFSARHEPC